MNDLSGRLISKLNIIMIERKYKCIYILAFILNIMLISNIILTIEYNSSLLKFIFNKIFLY